MPCSTPTTTTTIAVIAATTNSPRPEPGDVGIPRTSISLTPMRKTTEESTALGMYDNGTVRNKDDNDEGRGNELRNLAATAGAVDHLGLGWAAVYDKSAADAGSHIGQSKADQVDVLIEAVAGT